MSIIHVILEHTYPFQPEGEPDEFQGTVFMENVVVTKNVQLQCHKTSLATASYNTTSHAQPLTSKRAGIQSFCNRNLFKWKTVTLEEHLMNLRETSYNNSQPKQLIAITLCKSPSRGKYGKIRVHGQLVANL